MAIYSPLLRQLRQKELENLRIAARLKQKRLKIEAEIAEIESETETLRRETEAFRRETEQLRAGKARLLSMFCEVVASKSTTTDALVSPTR
jgi:chromosome condensin MukBEF ATPase and DNA-binding subunit MukB